MAAVAALAVVLAGCGGDAGTKETTAALERPSPTPSPTPTPTPPPPVVGTLTVSTVDASEPTRLGFPDDPPPDEAAAAVIASGLGEAMDRHLTALQDGGEDLHGLAALWTRRDDQTLASLTTSLATPDVTIEAATYDVTVLFEAGPTVALVTATVERADGSSVVLDLVFDVSGDRPLLHLVGGGTTSPATGADATADATAEDEA